MGDDKLFRQAQPKPITSGTLGAAQPTLDSLRQLFGPAEVATEELRRAVERRWPRKPSLRVLHAESRDMYGAAVRLVEAGGRYPAQGVLVTVMAAAYDTLDVFGQGPTSDSVDATWEWNANRVAKEARPEPDPAAASALREATNRAQVSYQNVCELLDDVATLAPPEAWLPDWGVEEARADVLAVGGEGRRMWQRARPPQPPHTYTVRGWRPDLNHEFLAFAQLIQARGELKTWGGRIHAYLELDGRRVLDDGGESARDDRAPTDAPDRARTLLTRKSLMPTRQRVASTDSPAALRAIFEAA